MNVWIEGARPKTLVASIVPVLVGTAVAAGAGIIWWRFAAAMVVAVAIQVGVNYANDYFDGTRGVDTAARVGPRRLTASGIATHAQMKAAILVSFFVAACAGLALAWVAGWWLLAVGAVAFLAALGYSGGPKPYASAGLGELFVFVFFGVVATAGSAYVHAERVTLLAFLASIPVGLLAVAILVVNNLRDIETDAAAGKRTLAVRLGRAGTRRLYRALIFGAFVSVFAVAGVASSVAPLLALFALSFVVKPTMLVGAHDDAPGLVRALVATAQLQLIFGALLALGLWLR